LTSSERSSLSMQDIIARMGSRKLLAPVRSSPRSPSKLRTQRHERVLLPETWR
jgi:hypothetical protein